MNLILPETNRVIGQWRSDSGCHPVRYCYMVSLLYQLSPWIRQLEVDVGLCADTAWTWPVIRKSGGRNDPSPVKQSSEQSRALLSNLPGRPGTSPGAPQGSDVYFFTASS